MSWLLTGLTLGAGGMYLLDPDRGRRRRAELEDRTRRRIHDVEDLAGKARRDVENRAHGLAARARGGGARRQGPRRLGVGWTPMTRMAAGLGGAVLALWGLRRRGVVGLPAGLAGLSLLARATAEIQNVDGRPFVRVAKTLTIRAPIEEVFAFWSRFENYPRFMEHVLEASAQPDGRVHWKVLGPARVPVEWDAWITERVPNRKLAWRSIEGSQVEQRGEVHFEEVGDGETRVSIHMAYRPPGGALTHAVASFLHGDPKHLMDDDLLRLKSLLEHGKATAGGHEVHRDDLA